MGANAVTTVPVYTAGEVLTAADLNITNSGIPVFADSTARDNSFGGTGEKVLAEGQFAYLENSNTTQYYTGSAWLALGGKLGQVVSTAKTDTFTMSSTTYADITGLSVSITPSSTSSKVLVIADISIDNDPVQGSPFVQIVRDSTAIGIGDAAGSRRRATGQGNSGNTSVLQSLAVSFLDSPATTSATTYKIQIANQAADAVYVNRSRVDTDSSVYGRTISTITVMEILA
jgi:hypothetical protein